MAQDTTISLDNDDTRLAALRSALVEGEQSGEPEAFDFDAFVAAKQG